MKYLAASLLLWFLLCPVANAQTKGTPAIYTGPGGTQTSKAWYDASLFDNEVCLGIQKAIAAATPATAGIVIDARHYRPTTAGSPLPCTVNPFAVLGDPTNPIVLVVGGDSASSQGAAGTQGGIVLLPGAAIATDVPWLVPQSWSIFGEGAQITTIVPSTTFQANKSRYVDPLGATVSTSSTDVAVTGHGTTWPSSLVGMVLFVCNTCSSADYTNAQAVGIVTDWVSGTRMLLGTPPLVTIPPNGQPYVLQAPLMAWATTTACTTGTPPPPQCSGVLQTNTTGSVIQDIGLDCQGALSAPVQGCIPFWDQYGQERSLGIRWQVSNFASQDNSSNPIPSIGIGIYGSTAQNGGPFEHIQMSPGALVDQTTTCVEVGGALPVVAGLPNHPPMRGIHGLTCTGPHSPTAKFVGTGVDINTQNFTLSNAHFENLSIGVRVGKLGAATGINVQDVTGGIVQGTTDTHVPTMVDIKPDNASTAPATADINLSALYQPYTTGGPALNDEISGNVTSEAVLSFYSLGNGTGTGGANTRPILTTSSSFSSTPCATCVSSAATLANNAVLLGGGNRTAQTSSNFNVSGAQLNLGSSGASGVLGLIGSTSGSTVYTLTPNNAATSATANGSLNINGSQLNVGTTGTTGALGLVGSSGSSYTLTPNAAATAATASGNLTVSGGTLQLGTQSTTLGTLLMTGSTSGAVSLSPPAVAGNGSVTLPSLSGSAPVGNGCGSTNGSVNCGNVALGGSFHIIFGVAQLSSGLATISNILPAFTNNTTWNCVTSDTTTPANASKATPNSGNQLAIAGSVSDKISYICMGN